MSYRIVQVSWDDIWSDPDNVALMLTRASHREHKHYRLSGVVAVEPEVLFIFEPDPQRLWWRYVIKPFPSLNVDDVIGEIQGRWQGKFSTRGYLRNGDELWGIFECERQLEAE